jgi:hypothetical protein
MRALAILAGVVLFGALLTWGLRQQARVECEACFSFRGHTECLIGRGENEAMAIQAARTGVCAVLGSGVTDAVACGTQAPTSASCREL